MQPRFAIGHDPVRACWVLREHSSRRPGVHDIHPSVRTIRDTEFDSEESAFEAAGRRSNDGDWMTWVEFGVSAPVKVYYSQLRDTMGPQELSRTMKAYRAAQGGI